MYEVLTLQSFKETEFTVVLIIPNIVTIDLMTLLLDYCMIYFSEVGVQYTGPQL